MKKVLMTCLVLLSVLVSSTAFSAIPDGKFPIQVVSSRDNPNDFERIMTVYLQKALNSSRKYRATDNEENRIMLSFLINEYIPAVSSSDWLASASPIKTYSIVWLAKPKNKHAYIIWHDSGRIQSDDEFIKYILEEANTTIWKIKNQCPYVFD